MTFLMSKLLSIIIPTRNRQVYCLDSVKSILNDIDEHCEIIIQDNSSDDSLQNMLSVLNCERIVYNYTELPLSFIDNFEKALLSSSGKFFIILGDDDSVTKDIIPIVQWMDREDIESLSSTFVVDYIWPNDKIEKYNEGLLSIPAYTGAVKNVNVDKNLQRLIKNGFLGYQSFNLPRTYHGIVRRSCMDKVKEKVGRYFGGLTPDIFSTVALACVIKNHKIIDFPFSIAGACPASATVNATIGGHAGQLIDAPHFKNRGKYEWENLIPRYYSVETIWAESAIKALRSMDYLDWENKFNKYKLYVYGIYINRKYIFKLSLYETLSLQSKIGVSKLNHIYNLAKSLISIFISKFFYRQKSKSALHFSIRTRVFNLNESKLYLYSLTNTVKKNFIK